MDAIAFLCSVMAIYILAFTPKPQLNSSDVFENVTWGKLFVAAVYASLAVAMFIAASHVI